MNKVSRVIVYVFSVQLLWAYNPIKTFFGSLEFVQGKEDDSKHHSNNKYK